MKRCRLVLTGSGGQGVITAAIILAETAVLHDDLNAVQSQAYGPEARGGATRSDVIISKETINFPKVYQPNVLVCLTQQAYKHAGITLTRTTYTQINEGTAVSPKALEPGDLIFSRGSAARPEHVGMYIGPGLAIEAPRTGKPVRITPLADWSILAARRVI